MTHETLQGERALDWVSSHNRETLGVADDEDYPTPFFYTTTRDDRVHPGHAREMGALMEGLGHPIYYYEKMEGGHGSGVTPEQRARMYALTYAYLLERLQ